MSDPTPPWWKDVFETADSLRADRPRLMAYEDETALTHDLMATDGFVAENAVISGRVKSPLLPAIRTEKYPLAV